VSASVDLFPSRSVQILPYSLLQQTLHLSDVRALEDLVIETIYAGLLEGHLNQKDSTLEITSAMGRDIGPEDVENMLQQLGAWSETTSQAAFAFSLPFHRAS
jgi:COP9 signalosome complex subunit 7